MSPRRKQGRSDNIVGWVFADPWRKLGAIALALVSWEYLDKRVNAELNPDLEIRLPGQDITPTNNYLRIAIKPQDYTLTQDDVLDAAKDKPLPNHVIHIEMKGEKATIDRMRGALELVYRPTNRQLETAAKTGSLTFGIEDLSHEKGDLAEDLKSLSSVKITPDRIRLRIRPNATKSLPLVEDRVRLEYGTSGLKDRLSSPVFSSTNAELRGPQQAIQNLPPTGPIFLGRVGEVTPDATTVRIDLELLPGLKEIVTTKEIFVTYQVEPDWQPYEFRNVPVDIDNRLLKPEQKLLDPFRVTPKEVPVKLDVKGDLAAKLTQLKSNPQELADFCREHLRLVVYPEPADLTRKGPWPMRLDIEFVRFEDIPTPRKGIDFKVMDLQTVTIIRKSEEK
jgi:hypothetical protein